VLAPEVCAGRAREAMTKSVQKGMIRLAPTAGLPLRRDPKLLRQELAPTGARRGCEADSVRASFAAPAPAGPSMKHGGRHARLGA
jgi:hypothetical protein